LHNEELRNFHSPNIISVIKPRRVGWAVYVARIEEMRMRTTFCSDNLKRRGHMEDLDVCGRIILELILEEESG